MNRGFQILTVVWLSIYLVGCTLPEKDKPIWEKVKIGDIAPAAGGKRTGVQSLKTINFDANIYEIPAENIGKLKDVWQELYTRTIRFNNYDVFKANSFAARYGQAESWNKVRWALLTTDAQKVVKVSMLLPDGLPTDLAVTGLDRQQNISYISSDGTRERATVGPGIIVLRMKAAKVPAARGVCDFVAYPVFVPPPMGSFSQQLTARAKLREFYFGCASFGSKMGPGDFLVLTPNRYISDQTELGGLFFSKPEGSMFFSETDRKPPKRKAAVRIFVLVCTGINY